MTLGTYIGALESRISATSSIAEATRLLEKLSELKLLEFHVVGHWMKYDSGARRPLIKTRDRILRTFKSTLKTQQNYLIWARLQEAEGLDAVENSDKPFICFVDEIDTPGKLWAYAGLLSHLAKLRRKYTACFFSAGSQPNTMRKNSTIGW